MSFQLQDERSQVQTQMAIYGSVFLRFYQKALKWLLLCCILTVSLLFFFNFSEIFSKYRQYFRQVYLNFLNYFFRHLQLYFKISPLFALQMLQNIKKFFEIILKTLRNKPRNLPIFFLIFQKNSRNLPKHYSKLFLVGISQYFPKYFTKMYEIFRNFLKKFSYIANKIFKIILWNSSPNSPP